MKMNLVDINGKSSCQCTNCNFRFNTDYAKNPYMETVRIAHGKYKYCPNCGEKYEGCQIEGVDFNKCPPDVRLWATAHGVIGGSYAIRKTK